MITTVIPNQAVPKTFQTLTIPGLADRPPRSRSPTLFQATICNARPEVTVKSVTVLNPLGFIPLKTFADFPSNCILLPSTDGYQHNLISC